MVFFLLGQVVDLVQSLAEPARVVGRNQRIAGHAAFEHRIHQVQIYGGVAADLRLNRQQVEHVRKLGNRLILYELRFVRQYAQQLHRQIIRQLPQKGFIRRIRKAEARLQQRRPGRGVAVQELGRELRQRAVRRQKRQIRILIGRLA